jgi:hypothetical protein
VSAWYDFIEDETGAITVDWVVLSQREWSASASP